MGRYAGKNAVVTGGGSACAATGRTREVGNMVVLPASASLVQR